MIINIENLVGKYWTNVPSYQRSYLLYNDATEIRYKNNEATGNPALTEKGEIDVLINLCVPPLAVMGKMIIKDDNSELPLIKIEEDTIILSTVDIEKLQDEYDREKNPEAYNYYRLPGVGLCYVSYDEYKIENLEVAYYFTPDKSGNKKMMTYDEFLEKERQITYALKKGYTVQKFFPNAITVSENVRLFNENLYNMPALDGYTSRCIGLEKQRYDWGAGDESPAEGD